MYFVLERIMDSHSVFFCSELPFGTCVIKGYLSTYGRYSFYKK